MQPDGHAVGAMCERGGPAKVLQTRTAQAGSRHETRTRKRSGLGALLVCAYLPASVAATFRRERSRHPSNETASRRITGCKVAPPPVLVVNGLGRNIDVAALVRQSMFGKFYRFCRIRFRLHPFNHLSDDLTLASPKALCGGLECFHVNGVLFHVCAPCTIDLTSRLSGYFAIRYSSLDRGAPWSTDVFCAKNLK